MTGFASVQQMVATHGATWAHRGGSASFPEMSEYAYQQSALAGYGALEFSTGRSSDGVWFGLHDETLDRTSQIGGNILASELTWAQIQDYTISLNAGGTPRPYYKLVDFLEAYGRNNVVIIDFKYGWAYREELWAALSQYPAQRIIIKFHGPSTYGPTIRDVAAAKGWSSWGYYYETDLGSLAATQANWALLGMDYTASQSAWNQILAYEKPVVGHIAPNLAAYNTAMSKGADMVQVSGVAVVPAVGAPDVPPDPEPARRKLYVGSRPVSGVFLGSKAASLF